MIRALCSSFIWSVVVLMSIHLNYNVPQASAISCDRRARVPSSRSACTISSDGVSTVLHISFPRELRTAYSIYRVPIPYLHRA